MTRTGLESIYARFALMMAERSTCARLHVGCVIVTGDHRKVLALGHNGNADGLHQGCDREEPGNCGCLHAEENAVINLDCPRDVPKVVYCTHLPCAMCAKRLINAGGVARVAYVTDYRKRDGVKILVEAGIGVVNLAGTVPAADPSA